MSLLDVLNGMQNGPRGAPQPTIPGSGGMSKTTMALLGFIAYKAWKSFTESQAAAPAGARPTQSNDRADDEPGGLAGVLRTIFGGGSVPGTVLSRGASSTVRDLERSGHGDIGRSWVERGANQPITPRKLEAALGEDAIRDLIAQTGMERQELLEVLSEHLPRVIDHLTPDGRLPTEQEAARLA
jgi:uncharacterized protein YidB (DUF937 family)